jgi:uncharacterized membrane protein YeaQ/YmgE (transglycosylase-associated protein family)
MIYVLWALVGWCGTSWPHRWWPHPPPPPDPDPWWYTKFAGVIGGLLGGWVYDRLWPIGQDITGVTVAATALGAFVGATLIADIVGLARGGRKV